jgi:hypothetical protein
MRNNFVQSLKVATSLDPGLRRDDDFKADSFSNVIPAQAGIQCLSAHA